MGPRVDLELFERFAEHTPDAMVVVDSAGAILLANTSASRIFGYEHDELVGAPIEQLVPERFRRTHGRHRDSYFAEPRMRRMGEGRVDLRGRRRDGSEFPAEISLSTMKAGDAVLATASIRDISDRVEAERERAELEARLAREKALAQSSRMESVGQLAGGVAHDFNNLLSVIIGNASFLADIIQPGDPGATEVEEVRRAAAQAAGLTRQLLTFSRRDVIAPEPADLNALVGDIKRLLQRTLGEHVELRTDLHPELPHVLADPGNIEQILVNLAVNARDAMPSGGVLTMRTTVRTLEQEDVAEAPGARAETYVRLSMTDTGEGMPPEVVERATEPFFSTKPKGKGTGLGLATVYSIVRQARGQLIFESTVGAGTTVHVDLPVANEKPRDPAPAPGAESGEGRCVLLVEDEDAVRRIAERILMRNGFEVLPAEGGDTALAILERRGSRVDVLLTDVVMPEMPGPDLARRAREMHSELPIVFMSGYVDPMIDMAQVPDAPVVQKPFTEASLTAAITAALQRGA